MSVPLNVRRPAHRPASHDLAGPFAPGDSRTGQHAARQPLGRPGAADPPDAAEERPRRSAQHEPGGLPGQARAQVRAFDVERVDHAQAARVGDVDLDEPRARHPFRKAEDFAFGVQRRDHERAVAVQKQRVAPVGQLQAVEDCRGRGADVDGVQRAAGDRERMRAVRLDDVGLVDALLLHVRAREVLAAAALRRGHPLARAGSAVVLPAFGERHERVAQGVAAGVVDEACAGAERLQAGLARVRRARLVTREEQRCGEEGGEQEPERHRQCRA